MAAAGCIALSVGCGASPAPAPPAQPVAAQAARPKLETIDATKLPAVEHAAPPLDEGRVQLSLPADWPWAPRSKDYLIKAQFSRDSRFPNVTIYAEQAAEIENVTADNALEFATNIQKTLDAELAPQGVKLAENVRAVRIGKFLGVEYVRRAKIGADSVERLFLVTVQQGRKYAVELRVLQGTLPQFRPLGRAVAASMSFPGAAGSSPAP